VNEYDDADAPLDDEMHAIGWVALRGDDVVLANFEPLAIGGELLGEVGAAKRLREPFAQASSLRILRRMGGNDLFFAGLQGVIEIVRQDDVASK
jgi:hypothetical protein